MLACRDAKMRRSATTLASNLRCCLQQASRANRPLAPESLELHRQRSMVHFPYCCPNEMASHRRSASSGPWRAWTSVYTRSPATNTRTCYRWAPRRRRRSRGGGGQPPGRRRPTGRSASSRPRRRRAQRPRPARSNGQRSMPTVTSPPPTSARLLQHRTWPAGGLRGGAVQARARPASSRRAARPGSRRGPGSPATARAPVRCGRPRRDRAPPRCRPRPVRPAVRDRAALGPVATSRPSGRLAVRSGTQWTRGSRSSALLSAAGTAARRLVPRPSGAQAEQVQQETALEETSGIR